MSDTWRNVAWSGVEFQLPAHLTPALVGKNYLLFDDHEGPRLELKWGKVKKRFSPQTQLKRLTSAADKSIKKTIRMVPMPAAWQEVLQPFDAALAFIWKGASLSGKGVILHCAVCQTATLIQFYNRPTPTANANQRVLANFKDHREDKLVTWVLYDIRAVLPAPYRLSRFRFESGEFELIFRCKSDTLSLYRWGPASVILNRHSLKDMAQAMGSDYGGQVQAKVWHGFDAIYGACQKRISGIRYGWDWIRRKPMFNWLQLWHVDPRNRILGVHAESRRPPVQSILESICRQYEVV
jgi:hypothetical protein